MTVTKPQSGQRKRLTAAGTALFGPTGWQRPFAAALEVDDRLMRRWISEERSVPSNHWAEISALLRDRGRAMVTTGERFLELADQCESCIAPPEAARNDFARDQ